MYPLVVILVNELVEVHAYLLYKVKEQSISSKTTRSDVGRLARKVLRRGRPSYGYIERKRAITAIDCNRVTPRLTNRVEALLHEVVHPPYIVMRRVIFYSLTLGDGASCHLP